MYRVQYSYRILETVRDTAVAKLYIKVALPLDPLLAVDKFQKVFPRNPKKKLFFSDFIWRDIGVVGISIHFII